MCHFSISSLSLPRLAPVCTTYTTIAAILAGRFVTGSGHLKYLDSSSSSREVAVGRSDLSQDQSIRCKDVFSSQTIACYTKASSILTALGEVDNQTPFQLLLSSAFLKNMGATSRWNQKSGTFISPGSNRPRRPAQDSTRHLRSAPRRGVPGPATYRAHWEASHPMIVLGEMFPG